MTIRCLAPSETLTRERELAASLADWMATARAAERSRPLGPYAAGVVAEAAREPGGALLVAEDERGTTHGLLVARTNCHEATRRRWGFVEWIAVRPGRRRRGVGTALVDAFRTEVGDAYVQGLVMPSDATAHGFWTAQGWQEGRATRAGDQVWMSPAPPRSRLEVDRGGER